MSTSDQRIDFLLVTQYFRPERGAAQVRLSAIVDQLLAQGFSVEVVTALPNYPEGRIFPGWRRRPVQRYFEFGAPVTRVWVWAAMGNGIGRVLNYLTFGVMSVLGILRAPRSRWVIVEYPTLFGALPAVVLGRLRRQQIGVIVADLWVDSIVATGTMSDGAVVALLRRVERWMLRRAHVVTAVTEGVRDALTAKGVREDRLRWLPNGADTEVFAPRDADPGIRARHGLPPDVPIVLYAGTHGFVHGLDVVLDAAELMREESVLFLLVGGGSEKPALEAQARRRGLANVVFREPVDPDEVALLLNCATVALATVRPGELYRTIRSAKAVPAMASGTPVVYSADDEGSRLVAAAGAGLVTPPGDAPALATALRELIGSPERCAEMGAAGRTWVLANSSWQRLVAEWLESIGERRGADDQQVVGWPALGFVGIHSGGRPDFPVSQNEVLSALFESSGYWVKRASSVRRPLWRTAHQVVSILGWWRVDVLVVAVFSGRSFLMAELATAVGRLTGKRVALFLHGGNLPVFGPGHRRRVERVLCAADCILAPSDFLADTFRGWGHRVEVIPNVVDVSRYRQHVRTRARPRLLWMRTFHRDYNPEMAVRVLAQVIRVHPEASMVMAGADHGHLEATRAEAERLGVADRIEFPGYIDHATKVAAFDDCDIFLNTNRIDNMPVSVVEASLSGLVPVATAVGGVPAIIRDGDNGVLVDDDDDAAMADAVLRILADPEMCHRMSIAATEFGNRSAWDNVRAQWEQQFVRLSQAGNG